MDDRASQGPAFLATGLNATASVLIALAAGKDDNGRVFLVFTLIFVTTLGLTWFAMFWKKSSRSGAQPVGSSAAGGPAMYDVFVSSPMASFPSEAEYERHREGVVRVLDALERHCGFRVYYAGRNRPTSSSFQQPDVGARDDLAALRSSERFLLVMPLPLVTSCYVEAGYALAQNKPSVYYHHRDMELPFMLRKCAQYGSEFPRCKKYEYAVIDGIVNDIETNKGSLFD